MTGTMQEQGGVTARRPASGIVIDPGQLTRMRDLVPLSREGLAERAGELLFDYSRFARVLHGDLKPDASTARALWMALDCAPADIITGLPADLPRSQVPRWLRRNWDAWNLDLGAVAGIAAERRMSTDDLARATARYGFSRDSVNKIERGERRPKARTLAAFCQILGCQPVDLMPGSRPLPEGATSARRDMLDFNKGLRAYAEEHGIPYRDASGRIKYDIDPKLREAYANYLAGQGSEALAS